MSPFTLPPCHLVTLSLCVLHLHVFACHNIVNRTHGHSSLWHSCHFVTFSPYHLVTIVTLSPCHLCHHCHLVTLSPLSPYHLITLSPFSLHLHVFACHNIVKRIHGHSSVWRSGHLVTFYRFSPCQLCQLTILSPYHLVTCRKGFITAKVSIRMYGSQSSQAHVMVIAHVVILITLSPYQLITISPYHLVTLSPCHLITLSPCHLVTLSLFALACLCITTWIALMSHCSPLRSFVRHFVTLSPYAPCHHCHLITLSPLSPLSPYHLITLSPYHLVTLHHLACHNLVKRIHGHSSVMAPSGHLIALSPSSSCHSWTSLPSWLRTTSYRLSSRCRHGEHLFRCLHDRSLVKRIHGPGIYNWHAWHLITFSPYHLSPYQAWRPFTLPPLSPYHLITLSPCHFACCTCMSLHVTT